MPQQQAARKLACARHRAVTAIDAAPSDMTDLAVDAGSAAAGSNCGRGASPNHDISPAAAGRGAAARGAKVLDSAKIAASVAA